MKITLYKEPFHFLILDNVYTEDELKLIWTELDYLYAIRDLFFLSPEKTKSATDSEGNLLKNNFGNFLQGFYVDRKYSHLMTLNQKIYRDDIIRHPDSWFFNQEFNAEGTLISYYENGGYYKPHNDNALLTACTWFWKEPKKFTGGNFKFSEYDLQLKIQNNCAVIFPSHIFHEVEPVCISEEYANQGYGRFCMTQFIERFRTSP